MTADRFVATHLNALDSSSKLFKSKQLNIMKIPYRPQLDSNISTTNMVDEENLNKYYSENESCSASFHGTEKNSLRLNISKSPDGSDNVSNKLEYDINNKIQSPSSSINSFDAFENWKGQGKSDVPKLIKKNKDVPKKKVNNMHRFRRISGNRYINRKQNTRSNLNSLLLNGNMSTLLKINKNKFLIYNTCPFNSVAVIIAMAIQIFVHIKYLLIK